MTWELEHIAQTMNVFCCKYTQNVQNENFNQQSIFKPIWSLHQTFLINIGTITYWIWIDGIVAAMWMLKLRSSYTYNMPYLIKECCNYSIAQNDFILITKALTKNDDFEIKYFDSTAIIRCAICSFVLTCVRWYHNKGTLPKYKNLISKYLGFGKIIRRLFKEVKGIFTNLISRIEYIMVYVIY